MEIRKRSEKGDSKYSKKDPLSSRWAKYNKGGIGDKDSGAKCGGCHIYKTLRRKTMMMMRYNK